MRKFTLIALCLFVNTLLYAQVFWTEDFGTGCNQAQLANGLATANGVWNVDATIGTNGASANDWFISATEAGMGAGNCGDGCIANSLLDDQTLHIANVSTSTAAPLFCPTGDCAAAYDDSTPAEETNKRAESPVIDCTGRTGIMVDFEYMMNGEAGSDFADLWYYDGVAWVNATMGFLPQTAGTCAPQGMWTAAVTIPLPASADNNPNVQIGVSWTNNGNLNAADPSIAVDNITLSSPSGVEPGLVSKELRVFPNPTYGGIQINGFVTDLRITDLAGRIVYQGASQNAVDLQDEPAGVYTVQGNTGNSVVTRRVVVLKH